MASFPITWWRVFFLRLQITGLHLPALCLQLAMSGSNVPDLVSLALINGEK
jgi:hypothetical protein